MKPLRFQSAALLEAESATLYYEEQREGLGAEFKAASRAACASVANSPLRHSRVEEGCRCCRLERFSPRRHLAGVPDFIEVVAVMHLRRRPGYWIERL